MQQLIEIQDVVATMLKLGRDKTPLPFSIEFVTANIRTKEAGQIIKFPKAVVVFASQSGTRKLNAQRAVKRTSNNHSNGTIKIQEVGTQKIVTVHLWLIREFNGTKTAIKING
jgi:hypothetical protein